MKVKKLQAGGYATYTPLTGPSLQMPQIGMTPSSDDTQVQGKGDFLSKDIVKQLLENGLINDVDLYIKNLNRLSGNIFSDPRGASQNIINHYPQINRIIQNKQLLTEAVKKANDNGGLSEYAITTTGQVIVYDPDGNLTQISANELQENGEHYQVLTNSDLAALRQTDPSLAFNTSVFSVIENGIGPEKLTDYILKIADKVGYDKETSEGFISKKGQDIAEGMEILLADGSDGIYKVTQTTKTQNNKAQAALKYIYSVLPQNMRNYLRTQSASMGMDPNKGSLELITNLLSSTLEDETSQTLNFETAQNKDAKEGGTTKMDMNQSELILNGIGTDRTGNEAMIINQGTSYDFAASMKFYQTPTSKDDNKPLGMSMTLGKLFKDTSLTGLVDIGSVYFGEQRIGEQDFERIVYDNVGFGVTMLPFIKDDRGHTVINLEVMNAIADAEKTIKDKGNITEMEKKEIYDNRNILPWYGVFTNPTHAIENGLLRPFVVFGALGSDDGGIVDPSNDLVRKIPRSQRDSYKRKFENAIKSAASNSVGNTKYDIDNFWPLWWDRDDMFEGTVYVPLTDDAVTQFSANKNFYSPFQFGREMASRFDFAQQQYKNPLISSSNILND